MDRESSRRWVVRSHIGYVWLIWRMALCLQMMWLASCATIGPSTVRLSAEVGDRISEMHGLHTLALQRYFQTERQRIEDFLTETWEPLFLKNFLGTSGIVADLQDTTQFGESERSQLLTAMAGYLDDESEAPRVTDAIITALDNSRNHEPQLLRDILDDFVEDDRLDPAAAHVASLLGTDDPAQMILEFAEAAHEEMQLQRRELMDPLDQAEEEALAEVNAAYAELLAGHGVLTARLEAASKVAQEQDRLLDALGGPGTAVSIRHRLGDLSTKVGDAIETARSLAGDADDEVDQDTDASAILDALREKLKDIF